MKGLFKDMCAGIREPAWDNEAPRAHQEVDVVTVPGPHGVRQGAWY